MITIAVIMYNQNDFLEKHCNYFKSFAGNNQIIFLDDGSNKSLIPQDFEYYRHPHVNFGHAGLCNIAVKLAKGKLILLLDGDTFLPENFSEEYKKFENENIIAFYRDGLEPNGDIIKDNKKNDMPYYCHATMSATIWDTKQVREIGFNENYKYGLADFEMALRLLGEKKVKFMDVRALHISHAKNIYDVDNGKDKLKFKELEIKLLGKSYLFGGV